jgi:hypothetical protein
MPILTQAGGPARSRLSRPTALLLAPWSRPPGIPGGLFLGLVLG